MLELLCRLQAISSFAKDCHYHFNEYSQHLLADVNEDDIEKQIDLINEVCYLGQGEEAPAKKDILAGALDYMAQPSNDEKENFAKLKLMIKECLVHLEQTEAQTRGANALLDNIAMTLQQLHGLLFKTVDDEKDIEYLNSIPDLMKEENYNSKEDKIAYVMKEFEEGRLKDSHGNIVTDKDQALAIAYSEAENLESKKKYNNSDIENSDKWITIKPNGDENKGKHIPLKDGESPAQAMKRLWGNKFKDKKSSDNAEKKEEKPEETPSKSLRELLDEQDKIVKKFNEEFYDKERYKDERLKDYSITRHQEEVLTKKFYKERDFKKAKEILDQIEEIRKKQVEMISQALDGEEKEQLEKIVREIRIQQEKGQQEKQKKEKEQAEKGKIVARENYYPSSIAGVKKNEPMTLEQANGGRPNPKFKIGRGFETNCQSCVVCYEARLRGYKVSAKPNYRNKKAEIISRNTNYAWIDPETGLTPELTYFEKKSTAGLYLDLKSKLNVGERYNIGFIWRSRRKGHIVNISKNEDGTLHIYDPQTSKHITEKEKILDYLAEISDSHRVEVLRVDKLAFNPEYMNDIMEASNE